MFKVGHIPWNKGKTGVFSEEAINKMSLSSRGRPSSRRLDKKYHEGYVLVYKPKHPFADIRGFVKEHRLVMEDKLKIYLDRGKIVHHINWDRGDNNIDNLYLFKNQKEHSKYHRFLEKCVYGMINYHFKTKEKDYIKNYQKEYRLNHKKSISVL